MDAGAKTRTVRKSRAKKEKKVATTKSLYGILSLFKKFGNHAWEGGGDAATKPRPGILRVEKQPYQYQRKKNELQRASSHTTHDDPGNGRQ